MTVAELIDKLKTMPQDAKVVFVDNEQGDCDVDDVELYTGWWSYDSWNMIKEPAPKKKWHAVKTPWVRLT